MKNLSNKSLSRADLGNTGGTKELIKIYRTRGR